MGSVETRKLGKHLFIFEKRKAKSPNDKAKGRTLIKSCTPEVDEKLPPEFLKYMRTLFDILDENKSGFVKLSDIEACWGQSDGYFTSSQATGVLGHLRKVAPSNGLLSFEILCMGFGQALRSTESSQIGNGFTGAHGELRKSSKVGQNSGSTFIRTPTGQRTPVVTVQVGKHGQASLPFVGEKFGEFSTTNGIRKDTCLRPDTGQGFSHKPMRERPKAKSIGETQQSTKIPFFAKNSFELSRIGLERDSEKTSVGNVPKEQSQPLSVGKFGQPQQTDINNPFSAKNASESSKSNQKSESGLFKTDTVFIQARKRPKSMIPFSEQKNPVDLSVAKKKGGILEGIQKTDKKAVIDKLKQWRNEEVRMRNSPGVNGVAKQFQRVAHGYQSDTEGGYCRQRPPATPVSCTGNETDPESRRKSKNSSRKSFGERFPRTTVYYQGQTRTKPGANDSHLNTTTDCWGDVVHPYATVKDSGSIEEELHVFKEGLRIVDEVRDGLVKRIAEIQEQKLYDELNCVSRDDVNAKPQDIAPKTSERANHFGKTGLVLERSHVESFSTHFKGLKSILDQVKHSKNDR